ncbi:HD domain-containing protein [Kribbella sp. NPDC004536]|uniref:HD domain-containing protein n=1 Tax=Kribbella sp. NPDC004536 TaxID=3364106 RepID=UPI00369092F7
MIGSPEWVARTGGALSAWDQVRFAAQAVRRELRRDPRGAGAVLAADRVPPSSMVAQRIDAYARSTLPDPLLQHSIRSWLWGCMLAEVDRIEYDEERLYVAALLHDVGLADRPGPEAACFAVHGSRVAHRVVIDAGGTDLFADAVADAIAAHFNVEVPLPWGPEAHLLHAGTHLDVVGLRITELARSTVADVHTRAPRDGFPDHFITAMREEAAHRRNSRAGVLWRLGMERAIHRFHSGTW